MTSSDYWMACTPLWLLLSLLHLPLSGAENLQKWSEQTYIGDPHTFTCAESDGSVPFRPGLDQVTLIWTKRGALDPIVNDDLHLLSPLDGVDNMQLTFKGVTEEMAGIYICHVTSSSGLLLARVVKGLNLGGHKYENLTTEYRNSIIVGFFTAFFFFAVVASACLFFHWDYCKPEQRQRRRLLQQEREEQQRHGLERGYLNLAMTSSSRTLSLANRSKESLREVSI